MHETIDRTRLDLHTIQPAIFTCIPPPHLSLRQHNISGLIHLFHPPISRRVVAVSGSSIKYFARILYIVHVRYCRIERMRSLR